MTNPSTDVFSPLSGSPETFFSVEPAKEMPGRRAFLHLPNYPRECAQLSV